MMPDLTPEMIDNLQIIADSLAIKKRDIGYHFMMDVDPDNMLALLAAAERPSYGEGEAEALEIANRIIRTAPEIDPTAAKVLIANIAGALLRKLSGAGAGEWQRVGDQHPRPHVKYLMRRGDYQYTVTPCYGMHPAWWVPMTVTDNGNVALEPISMRDDDQWSPLPEAPK